MVIFAGRPTINGERMVFARASSLLSQPVLHPRHTSRVVAPNGAPVQRRGLRLIHPDSCTVGRWSIPSRLSQAGMTCSAVTSAEPQKTQRLAIVRQPSQGKKRTKVIQRARHLGVASHKNAAEL